MADEPIAFAVDLVRAWRNDRPDERRVLILTGRSDDFRELTLAWPDRNRVVFDELIMRREGDRRPARHMKGDVIRALGREGRRFAFAVEDTPALVRMFRDELAIPCLCLPADQDGSISTSEAA